MHGVVGGAGAVVAGTGGIRNGDATPHRLVGALIVSLTASLLFASEPRMHGLALRERSLSAGVVQETDRRPERREIVARGNGLDKAPELLPQRLIGVSTGQGVQRPKRQPVRALRGGGLDSSA